MLMGNKKGRLADAVFAEIIGMKKKPKEDPAAESDTEDAGDDEEEMDGADAESRGAVAIQEFADALEAKDWKEAFAALKTAVQHCEE